MTSRHDAASRLTADEVKALVAKLADAITAETEAFSLTTFCRRHGISVAMFYKLANQGLGPTTFHLGTRVLVSKEAAAAWRRAREAASAADATGSA